MTVIEDLQSQMARHVDAQADVLGGLATAVAIFGPDRRLVMANPAFFELWRIPQDITLQEPKLGELLDIAREQRRLPEQADYRAWRETFNGLFTSLIDAFEDLLFLPDGSTVRMRVAPHPFGGLVMTFEDVTDQLTLERSINTLSEVQRETLDSLHEGLAVVGVDGRLALSNPSFRNLWALPDAGPGLTIRAGPMCWRRCPGSTLRRSTGRPSRNAGPA